MTMGRAIWLLLGSVGVVVAVLWGYPARAEPSRLTAALHFHGQVVTLTNADPEPWTDATIELTDGFLVRVGTIRPGVSMNIRTSDFRTTEGIRFNPMTRKTSTITVRGTRGGKARVAVFPAALDEVR